jgi:hypothetical protein
VVNTPAAYEAYLARYPGGGYADDAVRLKVRPRMRIIDSVIAPRVVVAPPAPRIALPLIQTRRAPGVPIVLPVVLSRPARVGPAAVAPAPRLPALNPAGAARITTFPAAPGQLPRPALPAAPGQNLVTTAPGQNVVPPHKLQTPNQPSAVPPRPQAINAPPGPNTAPQYRPPGPRPPLANLAPQNQPAQAIVRPANRQFRPAAQRAQLGPKPKPASPARCAGKECKR